MQTPGVEEEEEKITPVFKRRHDKQIAFLRDRSRFKFVLAGRRGGKTTAIVEDLLAHAPLAPDRGELMYIGPTHQQAKELVWQPILERVQEMGWRYYPFSTDQRIELSRKRKIYVIGAEKIRRIRGHKIFRVYLDEVAFYTQPLDEIWQAVRPALSDLKGGAIVATTPNGKGTGAYDFYLDRRNTKGWAFHHWHTYDNPGIDPEEVADARAELDERSFRQEYEATWEAFEGLAYYNFNEATHIQPCEEMVKGFNYIMALDFNVNPTTLLVGQETTRPDSRLPLTYFRKEYSLKHSSTIDTMRAFCADHQEWRHIPLTIYGDASGNARRSNTGYSDYYYIEDVLKAEGFNYRFAVPASNPPIVDRVGHVNGWLKNVHGESRIAIDPGCKDLIRDLSSQPLKGREPSPLNNLGHKADALGYYVYYRHLEGSRKAQRTIQL